MSNVSLETLRDQLTASNNDVENAKAILFRSEGMVMLLKHLIAEAEKEGPDAVLDAVPETSE